MKKAFTLLVLIISPTMALAQGTVVLENQTGLVKQWSATDNNLISVPKGGGYVELIAAPVGTALAHPFLPGPGGIEYSSLAGFLAANPGWALPSNSAGAGTPALIGLAPGIFAGGVYTINNIGAGANAEYFLIGWTGSATTADAAIAGWNAGQNWFSESAIAITATGDPLATPPGVPINLKSTFAGMSLPVLIPEPSSFALAGLGLAALLALCRRR
jgi:hypothetical protein